MSKCFLIPDLDFDPAWLRSHLRPGDRIIALKLAEFARMQGLLPGVTAPEEWIPYAEIKRLALRAYEINQAFAAESCGGELLEGYDWPRTCINMQDFFFRDILLAEALAETLKKEKWEKVIWVGNPRRWRHTGPPTSDVMTATFTACLGGRWGVLKPPSLDKPRAFPRLRRMVANRFGLLKKKILLGRQTPPSRCQVVAVFPPPGEWERFSDALAGLHREYGEDFQLWSVGKVPERMAAWANARGVQAVWIPYPDAVQEDVSAFFRRHWDRWSSGGKETFAERAGCRALGSGELEYHFDFFFNGVWPRTAQYGRVLEKYLQIARPGYLVGSTDPSASQLFVYPVASKMGIPSIALPHGSVQMGDCHIGSSYLACRHPFEWSHFTRSFPEASRVRYCRDAGNELSYETSPAEGPPAGPEKSVLILAAGVEVDRTALAYADRVAFLESFRRLMDIPADLRDLRFFIKGHPRWNLSAVFRALKVSSPNLTLLDSGLSLLDLVEKAWAVVMFNHFGSAVVHAIRAEKPILFVNSAKLYWPCTEWLSFPAGEVVDDVAGLWDHLRRMKDSPSYCRQLQERCRGFKAENFRPADMTLGQTLRALEREGPLDFPAPSCAASPEFQGRFIASPSRTFSPQGGTAPE